MYVRPTHFFPRMSTASQTRGYYLAFAALRTRCTDRRMPLSKARHDVLNHSLYRNITGGSVDDVVQFWQNF